MIFSLPLCRPQNPPRCISQSSWDYKCIFRAAEESRLSKESHGVPVPKEAAYRRRKTAFGQTSKQVQRLLDAVRELPPYVFIMPAIRRFTAGRNSRSAMDSVYSGHRGHQDDRVSIILDLEHKSTRHINRAGKLPLPQREIFRCRIIWRLVWREAKKINSRILL